MNTHHPTPPHRPKPELMTGYRVCTACHFQFTPESDDQTTCKLCQTASVFRARAEGKRADPGRKKKWHTSMVMCMICDRPFWARTPAAKICHKDECKAEGKRRNDAKRRAKAKRKEVA